MRKSVLQLLFIVFAASIISCSNNSNKSENGLSNSDSIEVKNVTEKTDGDQKVTSSTAIGVNEQNGSITIEKKLIKKTKDTKHEVFMPVFSGINNTIVLDKINKLFKLEKVCERADVLYDRTNPEDDLGNISFVVEENKNNILKIRFEFSNNYTNYYSSITYKVDLKTGLEIK